jgi:hypothetical protein
MDGRDCIPASATKRQMIAVIGAAALFLLTLILED